MFLKVTLIHSDTLEPVLPVRSREREMEAMVGITVAPLQRRVRNDDHGGVSVSHGTFVFPDISVRQEGLYRLLYYLYVNDEYGTSFAGSLLSRTFQVYAAKEFPGMGIATETTEQLKNGGLKVRVNKAARMTRKTTGRMQNVVFLPFG